MLENRPTYNLLGKTSKMDLQTQRTSHSAPGPGLNIPYHTAGRADGKGMGEVVLDGWL